MSSFPSASPHVSGRYRILSVPSGACRVKVIASLVLHARMMFDRYAASVLGVALSEISCQIASNSNEAQLVLRVSRAAVVKRELKALPSTSDL